MRLFVLARHAQSTLNYENRVNGDPAVPAPLTEQGREQARLLGLQLRALPLDACVHTRFGRTLETARLAIEGRDVRLVEHSGLDDIRIGDLEGKTLDDYRTWKHAHTRADAFPGGESLDDAARRYADAFERLVARPERVVLVVAHGLPIRYMLNAAQGTHPAPIVEQIEYATAYRMERDAFADALDALDTWCANPSWATSASP